MRVPPSGLDSWIDLELEACQSLLGDLLVVEDLRAALIPNPNVIRNDCELL